MSLLIYLFACLLIYLIFNICSLLALPSPSMIKMHFKGTLLSPCSALWNEGKMTRKVAACLWMLLLISSVSILSSVAVCALERL